MSRASGQLVVALRRDDRPRARQGAELQREDRNAAGAEHQHRVARLEAALLHQRVPRRQRGAGERRRLRVVQIGRDGHDALGVQHDLFGEHSVERSAERARHGRGGYAARRPVLEEASRDPVAFGDARDARADRRHVARAVRIRDARIGEPPLCGRPHGAQIAVVDRIGPHPDPDLPGAGFGGGPFGQFEGVDAVLADDLPDFHESLRVGRWRILARAGSR